MTFGIWTVKARRPRLSTGCCIGGYCVGRQVADCDVRLRFVILRKRCVGKSDGVVFGRASIASAGMGLRLLWIDVGVVNGKTGDLEAYYYEQVQSWSSPRDAMDRLTEEFSHNLPGATHAVKAKGSTLKASATDKKEKK